MAITFTAVDSSSSKISSSYKGWKVVTKSLSNNIRARNILNFSLYEYEKINFDELL